MAAPKGNQFWRVRTKHGPPKRFTDPDVLWAACEEYFEWVENNPLWSSKTVQFQGQPVDLPEAKMRAMTLDGLCLFLDITMQCWDDWRKNRQDLVEVTTRAERVIKMQKFQGAAADLLNANIIARDLGLRDASEVKHSGSVGLHQLDDAELDRVLAEKLQAVDRLRRE